VGLPAAFVISGVPCVVSNLWPVTDMATTLLMEEFYRNLFVRRMTAPAALIQAQLWLRNAVDRPYVIPHIDSHLEDLQARRELMSGWSEQEDMIGRRVRKLKQIRASLHQTERSAGGGKPF
jgi:CHAT domain-containing protein